MIAISKSLTLQLYLISSSYPLAHISHWNKCVKNKYFFLKPVNSFSDYSRNYGAYSNHLKTITK